jgi:hypothetical protein
VRLIAASREIDSRARIYQRRGRGPVEDDLLSKRVAVMFGVVDTEIGYGPEYPTLLMFAEPGIADPARRQ